MPISAESTRSRTMTKPIPDKAEVALEYPDKLYIGTFEEASRSIVHAFEPSLRRGLAKEPGS